jgi:hypothetical protein
MTQRSARKIRITIARKTEELLRKALKSVDLGWGVVP